MRDNESSRPTWRFFDGAVSVSVSMLLAVLLSDCNGCHDLPLLGYLASLTDRDNGTIIVGTLLLFPTSMAFYGGMIVFFAAKEFVEKRAMKRGREEGRREGRQAERRRIRQELAKLDVPLTPEQVRILSDENTYDDSE